MKSLEIEGYIFNPVIPEEKVSVTNIDVYYGYTDVIIKRKLVEQLKTIPELGRELVNLPSGIKIQLPYVEIGIRINSVKFNNLKAFVVEDNYYDLVLGKSAISELFDFENIQVSNRKKESKELLSIRIHSVDNSYKILNVENFLRESRRLFNVSMIIEGEIEVNTLEDIDNVIDNEIGIPENKKLQLSWIEEGSIWITLKSTAKSLFSFGKMLVGGKSSILEEKFYEAKKNKIESETLQELLPQIIEERKAEKEKFTAEHRHETNKIWREEMKEQISFLDEMITKTIKPELALKLIEKKNEIIETLCNQNMLPEIINMPDKQMLGDNPRNLPIIYEE
ncbi:MAG: hypothetical protein LBI82_08270 [Dysgonamonadaceae bacterium]|jgi:hypothetical protein|nr:hypothetical protein [Dysgonamonadaceae bacterium]